ncbi:MAG: branched-chain amino acid ABC transporter permease [Gammaproteobacteria bacterium]|nr:branched-chain amino acid ABC transporter permease [Gammaproteobacteria bacterium]
MTRQGYLYFAIMAALLLAVGFGQSWNVALGILNLCLISAIMSLGVNIQWGYAGLFNVGIMGFAALGGLAAVLISVPPVQEAWAAGGVGIGLSLLILIATVVVVILLRRVTPDFAKLWVTVAAIVIGLAVIGIVYGPAVERIEAINPAHTGYLGGLGLPILLSWIVGGVVAAGAAWLIGKISLGLRADYLAIATLGISEIIIAILKYEEWLSRGVKNVTGLPRPVPYEVNLVKTDWFVNFVGWFGADTVDAASVFVKLCYAILFLIVLGIIMWLSERALKSPWGRMMHAIRDNRDAANAMGKDVTWRHLQVFVLGCAVCGVAGAMMTTLDGQLTPSSYIPLRYTFLIWVMVIIGGSGNNWGSVLGGFVIWFLWIEAEPLGNWLMQVITISMEDGYWLKEHLIASAAYTRLIMMGAILLVVMRFAPRGLIPER